jgi:uncharacterized GH25 family protein
VTLLCASAASAHDFWLEPEKFAAERNEPVAVYFTIGHEGAHEPWNLRLEKVTSFKSCNTGKCVDETDLVGDAPGERGRARVAFARAGTHILAFESRPSFSELGADAFTDYAKKEGLTAVLKDRQMRRTEGDPGRELYSRRAKTLIQVHGADPGDVSAAVGHTLEIVPLKNPYALHPGATLPVRVLYDGEPLSGATIDLDDLSDELDALQSAKTDQDGSASFTIDGAGPFKLMTIWSAPRPERSRANYETIFASLTFGR